jgi:putative endonuclease
LVDINTHAVIMSIKTEDKKLINQRALLGTAGEELVIKQLISEGFSIKARNYRQKFGEIDIIAQKQELLVFVEVKLRQHTYFNLSEVITPAKQRKIIKTARYYIATQRIYDTVQRFDVALVELVEKNQQNYTLTYIPNAFTDYQEF